MWADNIRQLMWRHCMKQIWSFVFVAKESFLCTSIFNSFSLAAHWQGTKIIKAHHLFWENWQGTPHCWCRAHIPPPRLINDSPQNKPCRTKPWTICGAPVCHGYTGWKLRAFIFNKLLKMTCLITFVGSFCQILLWLLPYVHIAT